MMLHELAAIIKGCLLFIKFYCILSIGLVLKNTYRLKVNSLHWQSRIKLVLSHSAKNSSTMWLLIDSISPFWGEAFSVVSFSKHITYVAIGSLRGICVLRSGLQSVRATAGPEGARHNTGRWPLGASSQVHHNGP